MHILLETMIDFFRQVHELIQKLARPTRRNSSREATMVIIVLKENTILLASVCLHKFEETEDLVLSV